MPNPISRLREICLAMPGVTETISHGEPTFWAGGRTFAMLDNNHHNSGHIAVWCKAPAMAQEILVGASPDRFFVPPYVGCKGWVGVRLDVNVDWKEVAGIIRDAYEMNLAKPLSRSSRSVKPATPPVNRRREVSRSRSRTARK